VVRLSFVCVCVVVDVVHDQEWATVMDVLQGRLRVSAAMKAGRSLVRDPTDLPPKAREVWGSRASPGRQSASFSSGLVM
jgi:hypothetical protein